MVLQVPIFEKRDSYLRDLWVTNLGFFENLTNT